MLALLAAIALSASPPTVLQAGDLSGWRAPPATRDTVTDRRLCEAIRSDPGIVPPNFSATLRRRAPVGLEAMPVAVPDTSRYRMPTARPQVHHDPMPVFPPAQVLGPGDSVRVRRALAKLVGCPAREP